MKFRSGKEQPSDGQIGELEQWLRASTKSADRPVQGDAYWGRLRVTTNERIDRAVSPRTLSLNWLARVAIPGAVAVFSFIVALHYYAPVHHQSDPGPGALISAVDESDADSLLASAAANGEVKTAGLVGGEVFQVPNDQIAEYFVDNGKTAQLVEAMSDDQANALLDRLSH
jgi:hypothetical protein